jgi:hypothetical protein
MQRWKRFYKALHGLIYNELATAGDTLTTLTDLHHDVPHRGSAARVGVGGSVGQVRGRSPSHDA